MILVEIAYAKVETQPIIPVMIESGSTIEEAIHRSGILTLFPEINLKKHKVGIFSKSCELSHVVNHGDRIEIYRPLIIDPKEARRAKARTGKNNKKADKLSD